MINPDLITMEIVPDEDPDTSYLDQPEFTAERAAYDRGEFGHVGIRAKYHNPKTGVMATSAGLWSIEYTGSTNDNSYLAEIFVDEKATLLAEFGK